VDGVTNYFNIDASGKVGIGTAAPSSDLHITDAGTPNIRMEDTILSAEWEFGMASNDTMKISAVGTSGVQFRFTRGGGFIMQPQSVAPTTSLSMGMMYTDISGALCWYDGTSFQVVVGSGTCN
jgi:hypothetical protein